MYIYYWFSFYETIFQNVKSSAWYSGAKRHLIIESYTSRTNCNRQVFSWITYAAFRVAIGSVSLAIFFFSTWKGFCSKTRSKIVKQRVVKSDFNARNVKLRVLVKVISWRKMIFSKLMKLISYHETYFAHNVNFCGSFLQWILL